MEQGIPPWAQEIRERVVRIETKLDQYNALQETASQAKQMAQAALEGVKELHAERNRFVWALIGTWIAAAADFLFRRQGG